MTKFKEKATGRVWSVTNAEHLKHFRANPRYEEIKETKETKKVTTTSKKEEEKNKKNNKKDDNLGEKNSQSDSQLESEE